MIVCGWNVVDVVYVCDVVNVEDCYVCVCGVCGGIGYCFVIMIWLNVLIEIQVQLRVVYFFLVNIFLMRLYILLEMLFLVMKVNVLVSLSVVCF